MVLRALQIYLAGYCLLDDGMGDARRELRADSQVDGSTRNVLY